MVADNLGTARGSIEINTSDLKNADIALRSAGDSMLNFGMQAIGAFGAIVGETAKFEKEMSFVGAVTNASTEELDALREAAISLGKDSVFGPVELSAAFVELAKAGASVQDIIDGVGRASVELATAADVEIPFAGEGLINTLNTFKLGAEEAARVSDLLAGAANASSIELDDMFVTLKYAGPVAQGLGIEIEDLNDALSLLGKVGIRGSTAGTSLRQIMLNLSPPTERAADRMKELGILTEDGSNQFFDAQGNVKSLAEVFEILGEATKDLNNEQKTEALRDLFGVRAIPSALELLSQGAEGFAEINAEINRTTAADVAAKRMDNLDGSLKRLKATLSAVFVEAGGPFQQFLKGLVDGLREAILFFDKLPEPLKIFLVGSIAVIGVLSVLAGAFLLTIGNIVRAVRVLGEIRNAFSLFAGAARTATAANSALSASFLLNPMFLLAAAIVAVIAALVLLYFHFKPFRDFIDGLWQDIQKVWDEILTFFKGLPDEFKKAWAAAKEEFEKAKEAISNAAEEIYEAVYNWVGDAVDFLQSLPGKVKDALGKVPGIISDALGELLKLAQTFFFSTLPRALGYGLGFVVGRFIKFQLDLINFWRNLFITLWNTAWEWGGRIISWAVDFGQSVVSAIVDFITQLPGQMVDVLSRMLQSVIQFGPQILQGGLDLGGNFVNGIVSFLQILPGRVISFLGSALNAAIGFIGSFYNTARNIGKSVLDGFFSLITGLPGLVTGVLDRVIRAFTNLIGSAFNAAKNFAGGLWDGFKSGLGINSPSFIEEAMFAIEDQVKSSTSALAGQVRSLRSLSQGIPTLNPSLAGLTPAAAATPAGAGGGMTIEGPLLVVETLTGTEEEALSISRRLADEAYRQMAAKGQRVVLRGTT